MLFRSGFTDQGPQHAEMGLLAHRGGWRQARLWQAGYEFNTPLEATWTNAHGGKLSPSGSFISLESDSVYIGSVKRAEDDNDLVVRLVEAAGRNGSVVIRLGLGLQALSATETDLLELNPKPISASPDAVRLDLGPYQVRTVKINMTR